MTKLTCRHLRGANVALIVKPNTPFCFNAVKTGRSKSANRVTAFPAGICGHATTLSTCLNDSVTQPRSVRQSKCSEMDSTGFSCRPTKSSSTTFIRNGFPPLFVKFIHTSRTNRVLSILRHPNVARFTSSVGNEAKPSAEMALVIASNISDVRHVHWTWPLMACPQSPALFPRFKL